MDTFRATIAVFLQFRHRAHGLLLSELGAYLLSPQQAPAGTKRLSNLLRCPKWHPSLIARFLWQAAQRRAEQLQQAGQEAILLWDESVLEKPESRAAQGFSRSAPARPGACCGSGPASTARLPGGRSSCQECAGSACW